MLQSWPLKLGHLTRPTPINQCCKSDIIRDAVCSSRSQQHNIESGEGRMENEYLKKQNKKKQNKKTESCTSVPTIFVQDCS